MHETRNSERETRNQSETTLALARKAGAVFDERGFENPRLEAELLLASVLGIGRLDLYLDPDRPVNADELQTFRQYVRRRLRREPIQYITGVAHFRRLVLHVDRRVLIPRPETEVLAGVVIDWARQRAAALSAAPTMSAADIGTGSGAIALSLAQEAGFGRVVATDASADALDVARDNAERLGLADRIEFREGLLFDALPAGVRFDTIVSNPPYVAESDRASLPAEVRDWEPEPALYAAGDGLALLESIVDGTISRLNPGGVLAVEVGLGQATRVAEHMRRIGGYRDVRIIKDLTGRERVVTGEVE